MLFITYPFAAFTMIVLPLLLGWYLHRHFGRPWRLFGAGALVFIASQVVHLPLLVGLTALFKAGALPAPPTAWLPLFNAIVLGLLAGLCEELARYIAYRRFIRSAQAWEDGLMVGAGHGGIEAIILGVLVAATFVSMLVARSTGLPAGLTADQLAAAQQQIAAYWSAPWYITLLGAVERVFALCLHLALSVMVLRAVRQHAVVWLLAAIGWHALTDATAVYLLPLLGALGVEAVLAVLTAVSLLLLFGLRKGMEHGASDEGHATVDVRHESGDQGLMRAQPPLVIGPAAPHAIETHALTRTFDTRVAVDQLTLAIPQGCVFGFLGPNGAGKTTTVRMLAALIAPTSGTATVVGHQVGIDNEAIRRTVGILTETPGMYDRLSAWQNLVFFGQLYDLSLARASAQAERYLRLFDLWERRDDRVGSFSKGMRQKLAIARALLHDPAVVFLDEPTVGLDPEAARMVRDAVKALRAEGRTIFLTTHNLPEADELCDLVGIFRTRLLQLDTPVRLRASLFERETLVRVAGEAERWAAVARALPFVRHAQVRDETIAVALDDPDAQNPLLVSALVMAGALIRYVEPQAHSLEEVYQQVIEEA